MGRDEAGILRRLIELRRDLVEPLVAKHQGRIFKVMGDGMLVEFPSVVSATICALAWQAAVAGHQAPHAADNRLQFRIGINLGDVITDGDDIHGDGGNIAARLEREAEPGGICLSDDACRQARGKVDAAFTDLGERALKNVVEPVRIYSVNPQAEPARASGSPQRLAGLPDKPSVAVLPFANMSADPEQEYFSDGISADIITELSRYHWLAVIARSTTISFRDAPADIGDVGRQLGVCYAVTGSVRKAGSRVRVTVHLVDALCRPSSCALEAAYGTPPASAFTKMPFANTTLGAEQPLLNLEPLG